MKTLKMIFGAAYILAALLFFTACPDPPEEKGYFFGKITDEKDGTPLANVEIKVTVENVTESLDTKTSQADGSYQTKDLPYNSYKLTFKLAGYTEKTLTVPLEGKSSQQDVKLSKATGTINGTITKPDGSPLKGALVKITVSGSTAVIDSRTTSDDGKYEFIDMEPQKYSVTATHADYVESVKSVDVVAGQNKTIDFQMSAAFGSISGVVSNAAGEHPQTTVQLSDGKTTTTDTDGNYIFERLTPQSYTVTAKSTGYTDNIQTITVVAGQNTPLNINMGYAFGGISGTINDSNGHPLAGASIQLDNGLTRTSDNIGKYTFQNLEPKGYSVTVTLNNYLASTKNITVVAGETKPLDFNLVSAYGSIIGVVTDGSNNQPLAGVNVSLAPGGQTKVTSADGKFTFNTLDPKEFTIQYQKDGYANGLKTVTVVAGTEVRGDITLTKLTAKLEVTPLSLAFGENTIEIPVTIENKGVGNMVFQITESLAWLSFNNTNGTIAEGKNTIVTATVDRSGVAYSNNYNGTVVINAGEGGEKQLAVTMAKVYKQPTVTIETTPKEVTNITARIVGNITDLGTEGSVTAYGHCWSASNNTPTTADLKSNFNARSSVGEFTTDISGLSAQTSYYVRAYITNNFGTYYSSVTMFTTQQASAAPGVVTISKEKETHNSAVISGRINYLGGTTQTISQYGFWWSETNGTAGIGGNKNNLGTKTTTGDFSSQITGLKANTTYYVRAYATNTIGTTYGDAITIKTTIPVPPTAITTGIVSNVLQNVATVTGSINDVGIGITVSDYGHCYSTVNQTPTTDTSKDNFKISKGSTTTAVQIVSNLTNLTSDKKYYVRAYMVTNFGIIYGDVEEFTTAR